MHLILIRGLPGSGKSTLAKVFKANGYEHFEADQFFVNEHGEYKFEGMKIGEAHFWCQDSTWNALEAGSRVVVSNTFTTLGELLPYFEIARYFNIVPQVILCQNTFKSIHGVPEDVYQRMKSRFQYNLSELFDYHMATERT